MRRSFSALGAALALSGALLLTLAAAPPAGAAAALSIRPITWNVIGLDSNDVTSGPNVFPVGVRVCSSGSDPATAVAVTFAWTSANAALDVGGPETVTVGDLGIGACRDVYWPVTVARAVGSYGAARSYQITASSAEGATAATPSPRELFVEQLISQNRNSVNSISGPSAVLVGDTVTYTVDANTATNGYEQLESFLTLPSSIFELLSTSVAYGAPPGATNDTMYADACGWDNLPTSATYLSCIGPEGYVGGKAGGSLLATYTVRVIGAGTASLSAAIYDQSGSSYHYNSDFGTPPNLLVVTASQPGATTTTTVATTTTAPGATSTGTDATLPASSTASSTATATTGSKLAATGRSSPLPLTALGLALLLAGAATTTGARWLPTGAPATALERRVHELRAALYEHESDPFAPRAWALLDALDELNSDL